MSIGFSFKGGETDFIEFSKSELPLPEKNAIKTCSDVLEVYYKSKYAADLSYYSKCEFKYTPELVNDEFPVVREFELHFTSSVKIDIDIYCKCSDENTCEYYLCLGGKRYLIGNQINTYSFAKTYKDAKNSMI